MITIKRVSFFSSQGSPTPAYGLFSGDCSPDLYRLVIRSISKLSLSRGDVETKPPKMQKETAASQNSQHPSALSIRSIIFHHAWFGAM